MTNLRNLLVHPAGQVTPVSDGLIRAGSLLVEDLDEDLHGADEDGSQGLDLLQVLPEILSLLGVEKVSLPALNIVADFGEAGAEILHELNQVLHGLDDLRDGEVVQHLLAVPADFPHLGRVKGEQHVGGTLGKERSQLYCSSELNIYVCKWVVSWG